MDTRTQIAILALLVVPALVYESWPRIGSAVVAGILVVVGIAIAVALWLWIHRRRKNRPHAPGGPIAAGREPIPAGLRFAVLRRDGFRCVYCGRGDSDNVKLHLDHLVPVARGGKTEIANLVAACQDCNLGKSASDLIGPDHSDSTSK